MTSPVDDTHDPARRSWVESANAAGTDFPIQNLPLGVFRRRGTGNRITRYDIAVENPRSVSRRVVRAELDGVASVEVADGVARILLGDDAGAHRVRIVLG